jgi:hypothetical protein
MRWISSAKIKRLWFGTTPTEITATAAEINTVADVSGSIVTVSGDTTLTAAAHANKTILLDSNADTSPTLTLPEASGSLNRYKVLINTTLTNSQTYTIQMPSADGSMNGWAMVGENDAGNAVNLYAANAGNSDTIILNGTTNGGTAGDTIEFIDVAANVFLVNAIVSAAGQSADVFSVAV